MTNVIEASREADVLIFVVPHQFVPKICNDLKGNIKPGAIAISLIKVSLFCMKIYNKMFLGFGSKKRRRASFSF